MANGLRCPNETHGVNLALGETVSDKLSSYIAKWGREPQLTAWGVEREVTKCHTKAARSGVTGDRFSPFGLLDMYNLTGSETFARRFLEYATVYKGSRQLVWSRGSKDAFAKLGAGQKVRTDEEIVNDPVPQADEVEIATISADTWYLFLQTKSLDLLSARLAKDPTLAAVNEVFKIALNRKGRC